MFGEIKIASYAVAASVFAYFNIPTEAFAILGALIVIDTITGSVRALTVDHRSYSSALLRNGLLAKLTLMLIPLVLALVGKAVGIDMTAMVSGAIGILVVSEAYSIIANIGQITAKNEKSAESDAVSFLISKILAVLKTVMDALLKK